MFVSMGTLTFPSSHLSYRIHERLNVILIIVPKLVCKSGKRILRIQKGIG